MTTTPPQPIPMWLPHIGPEVIKAASDALEIGYLGLGSATKEFEDALADYLELGADRALMSTNSCTAALNCACLLAGAVYTLNDLVDVKADRVHPVKRFRPIASGSGGLDADVPPRLHYIHALGLPGKTAPKTAAELLKSMIVRTLAEQEAT